MTLKPGKNTIGDRTFIIKVTMIDDGEMIEWKASLYDDDHEWLSVYGATKDHALENLTKEVETLKNPRG